MQGARAGKSARVMAVRHVCMLITTPGCASSGNAVTVCIGVGVI